MTLRSKVMPVEEVAAQIKAARRQGLTVVMCHGCFDLVHPGHVRHLQHAARLGDRLLVTVTGDSMMKKGAERPLIPQELRAENLAALDCVTWVAVNRHPTAADLLDIIRPDVYVKGREYEHNRDPRFQAERDVVERHGGRVLFTSGDVVFSSTALINALEESASPFQAQLRSLIAAHDVTAEAIDGVIARFQGRRVLVIGEAIQDTYVLCERPAVAGESPMMTLRPVEHRHYDGGAAIIARHLAAMGARPTLLTALPCSTDAQALRQRLLLDGVHSRWIDIDSPMIQKQRFLVGTTKVMKLDLGGPLVLDASHHGCLSDIAADAAAECDALIIADFGQGLFSPATLRDLCERLRRVAPLMAGDVSGRRSSLLSMRSMDLLCPSESEVRDALHDYDEGLSSVAWRVLDITGSQAALATLGQDGLIAFERTPGASLNPDGWQTRLSASHVPALAPYAVDQLGCGDALLAAATLSLAAGTSVPVAALLGSIAAGAQAQRLGNAVIGAADLRRGIRRLCDAQLTYEPEPASILSRHPLAGARHDHLPAAHA